MSQVNYRNKQRGHSLLEAMMAAFLVLICALIFSATIPVANMTRGKAENLNIATSLSQKLMEKIRGTGYPNTTGARLLTVGLVDNTTVVDIGALGIGSAGETAFECTNVDGADFDSTARVLPNGRSFIKVEQISMDMRRLTVVMAWKEKSAWKSIRVASLSANL